MLSNNSYQRIRARSYLLLAIVAALLLLIICQIAYLNFVQSESLLNWSRKRVERSVDLNPKRGNIYDRNGELLATSILEHELWVDPEILVSHNPKKNVVLMSDIVGYCGDLYKKMEAYAKANRKFVHIKGNIFENGGQNCLKRRHQANVNSKQFSQIKELSIKGIHFNPVYRRYYPFKEIFAQIVGYVNSNSAQDGLEYLLEEDLKGRAGKAWLLIDGKRQVISANNLELAKVDGLDIHTTFDFRLQLYAYQSLAKVVEKYNAQRGSVILLHASSGEVLAVANYPSFNPNQWQQNEVSTKYNYAMRDSLEFGSVIKPFTLAATMSYNQVDLEEKIDVSSGSIQIRDRIFSDDKNLGILSPVEIIKFSSNAGIIKISSRLSPTEFQQAFSKIGMDSPVSSDLLLGKNTPKNLDALTTGTKVLQASVSHGYSYSLSALKLAQLYLMLSQEGIEVPLRFLTSSKGDYANLRRIDKNDAKYINNALAEVVKSGTGRLAQVLPYISAGKTGTAKIVDISSGIYSDTKYLSSFAGFAPLVNPEVICVSVIYEPQGAYYSSKLAAPLFAEVVRYSLRVLGIKPDPTQI